MVAVVAGKDDDGAIGHAGFFQRGQHLAYLGIHVGNGCIVAADGFLLAADIHLHVGAGAVIDARLGDIVPVAGYLGGQDHLAVGLEGRIIGSRGDEGHVRTHESDAQPERLVLVKVNQFRRFFRSFAIGVHEVIPVGFHDHEGVAAHGRLLAIGIVLQGFPVTRSSPFGALAVEPLRPGSLVVRPVTALLYANGYSHVIDLAHACGIVAVVFEMLRPGDPIPNRRPWTLVAQHPNRVRIITGQK